MIAEKKLADCAIIATQDQQHLEPAVAFAKKGYDIILFTFIITNHHHSFSGADRNILGIFRQSVDVMIRHTVH